MDQDGTWHAGRPRPRPHCAKWEPTYSHPQNGAQLPIFGPCLLWPNGWMDQDGTWHEGRPRSRQHCARWGTTSPPQNRGTAPQFSAHVYCGQTAGWMKMPLGTEVNLGPAHIVSGGDPDPPERRTAAPSFRPMSIVATVAHFSYCWALILILFGFWQNGLKCMSCTHLYVLTIGL